MREDQKQLQYVIICSEGGLDDVWQKINEEEERVPLAADGQGGYGRGITGSFVYFMSPAYLSAGKAGVLPDSDSVQVSIFHMY